MNKHLLPERSGFAISPEVRASFAGRPAFYELTGPGRLVRLLQQEKFTREGRSLRDSAMAGQFWFDELLFLAMRAGARAEIAAQAGTGKHPFANSEETLAALHTKFSLREDLAISKDWTNDFDAYAVLPLEPRRPLVALGGPVMSQPYYQHAPARAGLSATDLPGLQTQYMIDFAFPANRDFALHIQGPHSF